MLERVERLKAKQRDKRQSETAQNPVAWIEEHFRIPETPDNRLQLGEYQRACLNEALARNPDGAFRYSVIVWSDIKKSIKSTIAAAVALWRAQHLNWGSIKIVANDLKQADSRVAYYLRRAIELNPAFANTARMKPSGYTIMFPNRTTIEAIPVDPKGEAGGNDDMVCFSELWGANQTAAMRMWTEMTLSPTKFGQSFRWVETYAGFTGESPLLEQLYETGVKHGRHIGAELGFPDLEVYANEEARLFCLWNTRPRLPWQTPEYYAQEAAVLPPNEFQRVHRNQWVSSQEAFIDILWWDACREGLPPLSRDEPLVLGVDAATTGDSFAIVGVTRHPDPGRRAEDVAVRYCGVWHPPAHGRIDYSQPEDALRRLIAEYNVIEVVYDPYQLEEMMQRFRKEQLARCKEFGQGAPRLEADKKLYDTIMRRGIAHDGNPEMRKHLSNADRKTDPETRKLRIVKRSPLAKVDAAVALSMAVYECLRLTL